MKKSLGVNGTVFLRGSSLGVGRLLTAVIFSLLVAGPNVAAAELWSPWKSTSFANWEDWSAQPPQGTIAAVEQAAIAWCLTSPDYVTPGLDCTLHDGFPATAETLYGPFEISVWGVLKTAYEVDVHLYRNGGFHGILRAFWFTDTEDSDCPGDQVVDRVNGHSCIDPDKLYTLEKPKENTDPETCTGNPCDPATGIKTQTEVDFRASAEGVPSFSRFYTSKGSYRTGLGMAPGWRHTYSRELDEEPDRNPSVFILSPADQSSFYHSASDACSQGWDDIKTAVFGGALSQATGTLVGGNTCKISEGGQTKAFLRVRAGGRWVPFTPPSSNKTVVRPNGSSIEFEQDGANWVAPLNGAVSLEQSGSQWIFTDTNDVRETYDSAGRLVAITQRNGQTETLEYDLTTAQGGDDDSTTLDKVTGPFGHTLSFAYDANGQLASVTTPDGAFSYSLDAADNLVSVTYPDTAVRQYVYEDTDFAHHLTGIIDENSSRFATWAYDDAGRAILSEHAGGKESVTLTYNANGTTTIVSGNGASRTYTFGVEAGRQRLTGITGDVCSDCAGGNIKSRTYDTNGFLDEATDWNNVVTKTARNSRGLVETRTEALGTSDQRVTTTTWHSSLRLPLTVTTPKNTTTYTYDANGNMLTATRASGALSRAWTFTYDSNGRVLTMDGPRTDLTDVTTFTYYSCTTGDECGQLHTVTNALGQVTTYNSYDASGRVTLMTDPNGLQTALTYDTRGDVLSITRTPTSGSPQVTTMTYDDVGQLLTMTSPAGIVLTYTYDAAHYLASVTDNFGNKIEYTYDIMGNLTDEKIYDPSQVLAKQMQYTYDINNRIDTIVDGTVTSDVLFDLVGNLTSNLDGNGNTTTNNYDVFDRLDTITDALSGVVDYDYDTHDNVTQVAAANGATTSYVYDDLDNLISETSPDRGLISYTYDEAGNRLTMTDARGVTATYAYDALNRVSSISYPTTSENVTYTYDAVGALGYLSTITDESGTTTYTYDGFGRVATDTRQIAGNSYSTTYQYDGDGNIVSIAYPSGRTITYGRNTIGEITQVTSTFGGTNKSIVNSVSYAPFGPVDTMTYGNGVVFNYPRQSDYQPTGISSTGIAGKTYTYDPAGNISEIDDLLEATLSRDYSYDVLNRLESELDLGLSSYADLVLSDNPIGYWQLGESSGTTAIDASGNGGNGAYVGPVTLGQAGLVAGTDTAMRTNTTTGGYVVGPVLTGTALTGVEAWFQTDSVSTHRDILSIYNGDSDRILIYHVAHSARIGVWLDNIGTVLYSDAFVSTGVPHHLALWYDASVNKTYMMIDGITQQNTYSGNLLDIVNPQVLIGTATGGGAYYPRFQGVLDEVAVYAGSVSAAMFEEHSAGVGSERPQYVYDANGNRTSMDNGTSTTTYTYDAFSNRLNAIAEANVQLDASGNQIADQGGNRTFTYDDGGRLVEVRNNGNLTASYVHNAFGQRVQKTVGSATTVYVYDLGGNLLAEHDSNGTLIRDYVWIDGIPVAQIDQGEVFSYLHFDHLGTPRLATDDAQTVVWRWDSDAFGSTAANDDPDGNGTPLTVNLRFAGQYYDGETGLHYNYYRTYDPSTGRYLESDPVGLAAGLNTYGYVSANPLMNIDPFGLTEWHGSIHVVSVSPGVKPKNSRIPLPIPLEMTSIRAMFRSPCENGQRTRVELVGEDLEIASISPIVYAGSFDVTLDDRRSTVDGWGLQGNLYMANLGLFYTKGLFRLNGMADEISEGSLGVGYFSAEGKMRIVGRPRTEQCSCSE